MAEIIPNTHQMLFCFVFFFLHEERNLIATTLACENAKTIYRLEDYLAASFDASFPSEVKSIVVHLLFYLVIFKDKI